MAETAEKNKEILIREEQPQDWREVEELTREAFWNEYVPGCSDHLVAHRLRSSGAFIPQLDLVAVDEDGRIVGNIMYTHAVIHRDNGDKMPVVCFGPLSVLPELQGQGIGSELIEASKARAMELGYTTIVICGEPRYYKKFGFIAAEEYDVAMDGNVFAPALQILDLTGGKLLAIHGVFCEAREFSVSERETEEFDRNFPPKEKMSGLPSQQRFLELVGQMKDR